MYQRIEDYATIGNLRSAILVSKDGSVDWAPAPFIDSPSIFGRLLDAERGGFWSIKPTEEYTAIQKYIDETNILITTFKTQQGTLEVIDFIPIEKEKTYLPAEEDTTFKIKRKVTCKHGTCAFRVVVEPRFDYARGETELSRIYGGVHMQNGEKRAVLVAHQPFTISREEGRAEADVVLAENDYDFFVFRYNTGAIDITKDDNEHHEEELSETIQYWRNWSKQCDLTTCPIAKPWQKEVTRSALVLKLLFFEPVGTIAAAPTTSLPEEIGGVRNWDYRFTWLRDSAFILEAFFRIGHIVEAENYREWFMEKCHAFNLSKYPDRLKIMYGLHSDSTLQEEELKHLEGYKKSKPVLIGNDAHRQSQWDVYGSIFNMLWKLHVLTGKKTVDPFVWDVLHAFAEYVVEIWRKPDEGLWEVRAGKDHFVYSKVMCWSALDTACRFAETYKLSGDTKKWHAEKESIQKEIYVHGWNEALGSFTQHYDSEEVDASLLRLPVVGFVAGNDPKMVSTIQVIKQKLAIDKGLLRRYSSPDGLPGNEGAFLLASFWLVDALVLAGKISEAQTLFTSLLERANHTGLFSEEIEAHTGGFLGNFPQAYTHVGLINCAYHLAEREPPYDPNT